jgi:Icc-related predicted phosphoesterase
MRLLATADLHGEREVLLWLAEVVVGVNPDAVVVAGDILGCPAGYDTVEEAQADDAAWHCARFEELGVPVLYIMGNDDLVELRPGSDRLQSLHGRRVDVAGEGFVGYQHSLPFMGGVNERPEEEIREDLAALETLVDERTVLVTHSPARDVLDVGMLGMHAGSESIRDLVRRRRPRLHIHGHIHQQFGRDGCHFNVASAGERRAMLIDTETMEHEILRLESEGRE